MYGLQAHLARGSTSGRLRSGCESDMVEMMPRSDFVKSSIAEIPELLPPPPLVDLASLPLLIQPAACLQMTQRIPCQAKKINLPPYLNVGANMKSDKLKRSRLGRLNKLALMLRRYVKRYTSQATPPISAASLTREAGTQTAALAESCLRSLALARCPFSF